jgi:hypothetical protein
LSTTNPTLPNLGLNPGRRKGNPTTNRLSYGTTFILLKIFSIRRHSFRLLSTVLTYNFFYNHPEKKIKSTRFKSGERAGQESGASCSRLIQREGYRHFDVAQHRRLETTRKDSY